MMRACIFILFLMAFQAGAQSRENSREYKNVIRYNLSGAMLFGVNKYVVLGYERVISPRQSCSINVGVASLPKFVSIETDSFRLEKDQKNTGLNISADYRFYLAKENKFNAPHGLYIGPWFSYNHFVRGTLWTHRDASNSSVVSANSTFDISSFGFELGYQFVLWKRLTLDMVLIGPGMGVYNYSAGFDSQLTVEGKDQLLNGLEQLLTQKFPGMNYVFSGKHFDASGTIHTSTIGYRYIIHVGFLF